MMPEDPAPTNYWYGPYEGYEIRCRLRLRKTLGIAEAAAILHLRRQVLDLQAHLRRLEAELAAHQAGQQMRLGREREVYFEATWIELEGADTK